MLGCDHAKGLRCHSRHTGAPRRRVLPVRRRLRPAELLDQHVRRPERRPERRLLAGGRVRSELGGPRYGVADRVLPHSR